MSAPAAPQRGGAPSMAWAIWGLGALFFCYAFFQRVAPGVMVDGLMRDFAVSGAILGNLSAFYFYAYAGLQLPVGLLVDRWGPRLVLTAAAAFCAIGSLLFAVADSLGPAYLGRFLIGVGAAFPFVATLTLATTWFAPRRFAMLTGLTMLAGMVGAILGQAPLAALVDAIGWRATLAGAALAALLLSLLIWLVVRDRPRAETALSESAAGTRRHTVVQGLLEVLARPQTWLIAVFAALMAGPMLSFGGLWGVPYLMQSYGLTRPGAALTVSTMMVGWAVGAPAAGWLSDHLGRRRAPMIGGALLALLSMLALLYTPGLSLPLFAALLFVNGFASGSMAVCFAAAREHNPGPAVGVAYGFVNSVNIASGALYQPLIGLLLDLNWDGAMAAGARLYSTAAYESALAVLPTSFAVAVVVALFTRETWCRPVH